MQIGSYKIDIIQDATMKVDGGTAFADMEKAEWQQLTQVDNQNRLTIGINYLLLRNDKCNILIDSGLGRKLRSRFIELREIDFNSNIEDSLKGFSLSPNDITHVIFSHLHYDHAGGIAVFSEDKKEILTKFTNAQFLIQKAEWENAKNPNELSRVNYKYQDFLPLLETGNIRLLSGNFKVDDELELIVTGGHTKAHQMVQIKSTDKTLLYPGDICPTPLHLHLNRRESFDLFPLDTLQARKAFLRKALKNDTVVAFPHSLTPSFFEIHGTINSPDFKDAS
jgi:glyoxylase-like metal-dependent hydrolase (beta-lactamase superfamily II)